MNNSNGKTRRLAGLALFTAIVVVLQLLGSFIKVGPFAVSLVLIPIVVGAAVYGVSAGAWLGFVFGVVVTIAVVTGADQGGYIMFSARPVMTVLVCLIKGTAAGGGNALLIPMTEFSLGLTQFVDAHHFLAASSFHMSSSRCWMSSRQAPQAPPALQ